GHGWLLAQQIVHGEACYDTWVIDPRRFTGHATVELTALKAIEDYQNEFRFHFPHEHRPAGRNAKTTPLTAILEAEGAAFGVVNGWERMDYIKPSADFTEAHGFHFNEVHDVVAAEVAAIQSGVGLTEVNGFNRFEISGADTHDFLDRMICGRVPRKTGRVGLGYLLNHHGMIKAEATIANLPDRVWYGSAAASEFHDMDWLSAHISADEDVQIRSLTNDWTIMVIAGPKSRDVLSAAARGDWSAGAFPWLSVREAHIGIAPAVVMAVSFSGELAYEIHVPNAHLVSAYRTLRAAGEANGMRLFGSRAVDSMRLEKGFLHWKSDILTEFDPFETGLDRFVKIDKDDFIGKPALQKRHAKGPAKKLVTLVVDCTDRPAHPGSSAMMDGRVVGTVTSGDWGHRTGMNLALAFVEPDLAAPGTAMTLDLLGDLIPAKVIAPAPYDPDFSLLRS
ncbi:MAG: glycine cleavage T C-terminal barrel domain-containing protein, partial [Pseudomonadota bacterium]